MAMRKRAMDEVLLEKIKDELTVMLERKYSVRGAELHRIAKQLGYEWGSSGTSHTVYTFPDCKEGTSFTISGTLTQEISFTQVKPAISAMYYTAIHHEDMLAESRAQRKYA